MEHGDGMTTETLDLSAAADEVRLLRQAIRDAKQELITAREAHTVAERAYKNACRAHSVARARLLESAGEPDDAWGDPDLDYWDLRRDAKVPQRTWRDALLSAWRRASNSEAK